MTASWLLRVASHPRHGGGHVARSGVLAEALAARGESVLMVLDNGADEARARLEARGLSCTMEEPAGPWRGSVVDGYDFAPESIARLVQVAAPLAAIDDFLDPPPGAALVINSACHLSGDRVGDIPALLGPRYALVDPRFSVLPARDRTAPVAHIVVTFGVIDSGNATELALEALERIAAAGPALRVTVIAGHAATNLASLRKTVAAHAPGWRLLTNPRDMAPLLAEADLIIGAGGVSLLERMAAGVPSVTLSIADNQRLFVEGAAALGATVDAGDASTSSSAALSDILLATLRDPERRVNMSRAGRQAIDGNGPARVADRLVSLADACANAAKKEAVR